MSPLTFRVRLRRVVLGLKVVPLRMKELRHPGFLWRFLHL
jgi:hypothetical protein